ncbi:MAG: peptide ABC transporter substrate-binding protein [Chloroflexi bacterium B3_Chlor]|nr:MAG: peptide ABC transporter substrate-binding protein [Chloroflexi bacterium B3_Chlor]
MFRNKRWLLITNLVIVVVLVATACAPTEVTPPAAPTDTPAPGEPPPPAEPPEPTAREIKNPNTGIYATYGEPESLDPSYEYDTASYSQIFNVYETLVWWEREAYDKYVPVLAEEMPEISDDGMTWNFKVREGIKFHEGGDLTPEDIAYSFWRTMIQDRAGGPSWVVLEPLTGYYAIEDIAEEMGDEAACEFVKSSVTFDNDAMTVTINLPAPFGPFMDILASGWGVAMDKSWVEDLGGWDGDCANWRDYHDPEDVESVLYNVMNGTGPYKFDHWTPGEELAYVRNDDYWLTEPLWEGGPSGPAAVERIVWKIVDEWGTRYAMFEAGDADKVMVDMQYATQADELVKEQWDATDESDPSKMTILNEDGIAKSFVNLGSVGTADVFFNFGVETEGGNDYIGSGEWDGQGIPPDFFSDIHVRKAFNHCFDIETYVEEAYLGEALRRSGPVIEGMVGHDPDLVDMWEYDLAKCEEEFKLAWDGQVWENGFFFVITYNSGNDQRRTAAEVIEAGVESVNPNFSIGVLDVPWPTYLQLMVRGRLPLFIIGWHEDYHHPHNWVFPYMHSQGTFSSWQRFPQELYDKYDAGIAECLATPLEEAAACYEGLQAMAMEDVIDIFMVQPSLRHYMQDWVQGYYFNAAYPSPAWGYRFSKGYE